MLKKHKQNRLREWSVNKNNKQKYKQNRLYKYKNKLI